MYSTKVVFSRVSSALLTIRFSASSASVFRTYVQHFQGHELVVVTGMLDLCLLNDPDADQLPSGLIAMGVCTDQLSAVVLQPALPFEHQKPLRFRRGIGATPAWVRQHC
jgi:hypothetical protein